MISQNATVYRKKAVNNRRKSCQAVALAANANNFLKFTLLFVSLLLMTVILSGCQYFNANNSYKSYFQTRTQYEKLAFRQVLRPTHNKALVYIYRNDESNYGSKLMVSVNDEPISILANEQFLPLYITPGKHSFTVSNLESGTYASAHDIELKSDNIYYLNSVLTSKNGLTKDYVQITPQSYNDALPILETTRIADLKHQRIW